MKKVSIDNNIVDMITEALPATKFAGDGALIEGKVLSTMEFCS